MGILARPHSALVSRTTQKKQNERGLIVFLKSFFFHVNALSSACAADMNRNERVHCACLQHFVRCFFVCTSNLWECTCFHQWSERHLDNLRHFCTGRENKHFSSFISKLSWQKFCPLHTDDQLHTLKLFWLGFRHNNYTTVLKHSLLLQQQPRSLNRGWWQQLDGLCFIDPIALIKVVYRENTATSDGWLLVITQQPTNIAPFVRCADAVCENNPQSCLFLY